MFIPLIGDLGAPELLIILAVLVLLFGASKLPELARGSGRALRIFKAETKGLIDDDEQKSSDEHSIGQGGQAGPASTAQRDDAGATDPQGERRNNTTD